LEPQIVIALHRWAVAQPIRSFLVVMLAEGGVFLLPLVLGALWFRPRSDRSSRRQALLAGAISFALALVLVAALSHAVQRPRPFVVLGFQPLFGHGADSSFPSDHTLLGMALVGPLLWLRPRLGVWLALWAACVGLARVACGVHFPSDVVASALLAAAPTAVGLLGASFLTDRFDLIRRLAGIDRAPDADSGRQ